MTTELESTPAAPDQFDPEVLLVGALMLPTASRATVDRAMQACLPEHFASPRCGHLFDAMKRLWTRGETIDMLTVWSELGRLGLQDTFQGRTELMAIVGAGNPGSIGTYLNLILTEARNRRYRLYAADLDTAAAAGDEEAIEAARAAIAQPDTAGTGPRFVMHSAKDMLATDLDFRWAVRGLLANPTYGALAGEQKSLKTYISMFIDLAVATGTPLFGHFGVDRPGPVQVYVGEGGRLPWSRRLQRVARAMGISDPDFPLTATFDTAPTESPEFIASLRRNLSQAPVLVHIDPWYAFHGTQRNASNLFDEGYLLTQLSAPCVDAGANLLVNNHHNKTGTGQGLHRITQVGFQEWADTWLLINHRLSPDVANGRFFLGLEIGSRQWGGAQWELDLSIGRFDPDLGDHVGDITWDLRPATVTELDPVSRVVRLVAANPLAFTKEDLAKQLGGNAVAARQAVRSAEEQGRIQPSMQPRTGRDGKSRKAWVFEAPSEPPSDQTEVDDEW